MNSDGREGVVVDDSFNFYYDFLGSVYGTFEELCLSKTRL